MKKLQQWTLAIVFAMSVGGAAFVAGPLSSSALAAKDCSGNNTLLTLPAWYNGLATYNSANDSCDIVNPDTVGGLTPFIWKIVLNVIDILLQAVGYLAVAFIIYGGFLFLTSAGSPDGMTKARKSITNAVVGLIISIASVAIVKLIAGTIQ